MTTVFSLRLLRLGDTINENQDSDNYKDFVFDKTTIGLEWRLEDVLSRAS
jgi:hypothetical protein